MSEILAKFETAKSSGKDKWQAKCPCHDDNRESLSIANKQGKWLLHCHAGCQTKDVLQAVGLAFKDLQPQRLETSKPIEYRYHDENGKHVYSAIRKAGKKFTQRQADGTWSMKGVRRVPYNLPSVLEASTVFIVEGEKDVETLRKVGLVGTCNVGGAGKWHSDYAQYFDGKTVYILPDNDDAGSNHAEDVRRKLGHGTIVELPVGHKQDVSDWFASGGNREQLEELCRNPVKKISQVNHVSDGDLTENSLARDFITEHGENLRYVREWNGWLVWDGRRWELDQSSTKVLQLFREFADGLWQTRLVPLAKSAADRYLMQKVRTFCTRANSDAGARAALHLATADNRVACSCDQLNTNPLLLNVRNGTLNLESGQLQPHSKSDLITQLANVDFDADAKYPQWRSTLQLIFDGDSGVLAYLQQLCGYSFSGDVGEHILPIAYGDGCNGKSTVWNTLLELAGDYGTLAHDSLLLGEGEGHPTEKAQLYQKRLVAISEPERGSRMRESRVKELTGDSTINARRMREDFWTFKRTHKFWLSTNHLPRVSGTDQGIWRRIKLIPFTVDISKKVTPIKDYHLQLARDEGAGILNWLVEGYQEWKRAGFYEPESVVKASNSYRSGQDHLGLFIADCCEVEPDAVVLASDIYDAYKAWNGRWSKTAFGSELSKRFDKEKPTSGEYRKRVIYRGISLSCP